jgi:hypothetical protein
LILVWFVSSCGTTPDKALPREAAVAMTGSPATLADISRTLMVQGKGQMPGFTVTHYQRVFEFGRRRWRQDLTRISDDITTSTASERQISGVDGDVAFDVAADGTATRVSEEIARERKAELYHHPIGFLQAVFSGRGVASHTRREGQYEAVDMTIDGTIYTMFVDPATRLPARITSPAANTNSGNILIETTLANYTTIQGHRLPGRVTTRVDNRLVSDITFDQQSLAGNFGDLAAPAAVRKARAAAEPGVTAE